MPPLASSNLPMRRAEAPVKAPFSWPNSSDSSRFSGIAAQFSETKLLLGAAAVTMDVARQHLLAGAALAGDQHARLGRRDLPRHAEQGVHRRVLEDQLAAVVGDRGEDRGDQLGVRRQRQELAGAGPDRGDRGARIGAHAIGDHRREDALARQRADQPADVAHDVDQHEVRAAAGAQLLERGLGREHVPQPGAALDRDRDRRGDLVAVPADDQHPHGIRSQLSPPPRPAIGPRITCRS